MTTRNPVRPRIAKGLSAEATETSGGWYSSEQIKSRLDGQIAQETFLRKSLLFAELSIIAYMSPDRALPAVRRIGFDNATFFNRDGAQAYAFENKYDCVIACRGTEPTDWNDIRADLYAVTVIAETVGRVHRGFKTEVDDLWPQLERAFRDSRKSMWFTGHSLGGAMATICAGRCKLSHIPATPAAIFTYGSPRVGNRRYINYCDLRHVRWVNNNDIVPRVPPRWMGYRHTGDEFYFNCNGQLRALSGWQRSKDLLRGFVRGLRRGVIDNFADHSMLDYIRNITNAIEHEGRGKLRRRVRKAISRQQIEEAKPDPAPVSCREEA